jgi:hypothetical protein
MVLREIFEQLLDVCSILCFLNGSSHKIWDPEFLKIIQLLRRSPSDNKDRVIFNVFAKIVLRDTKNSIDHFKMSIFFYIIAQLN